MRQGLNNDDVAKLTRLVRAGLDAGLGPDEAWAAAIKEVQGVHPEVFEGWRKDIMKRANDGTVAAPRVVSMNVFQRVNEQEEQLGNLRRQLAEKGAVIEQLSKSVEEYRGKLAGSDAAALALKLKTAEEKFEDLVKDAKGRLAAKDEEIKKLTEQLEAANELLNEKSTPKKK